MQTYNKVVILKAYDFQNENSTFYMTIALESSSVEYKPQVCLN